MPLSSPATLVPPRPGPAGLNARGGVATPASGTARAAASGREAERLRTLETYGIMDTAAEAAFDELTLLAADLFRAPVALVSLVDDKRQWFKSKVGTTISETPREHAFCAQAIRQTNVFVVPDATMDRRFMDNPLVTGMAGIRFYAGAPLITPSGAALGTLCVIDHTPRAIIGRREKEILQHLAAFVMIELEYRRLAREAEQHLDEALVWICQELPAATGSPDAVSPAQAANAERVSQLKDRCYRIATMFGSSPSRCAAAGK